MEKEQLFDQIYREVSPEQKEQLRTFRATHPVRYFETNNAIWHYINCGQGPETLVLLPGGVRFGEIWFRLINALEQDYRLIVPTYPPLTTMADLVDGIAAILEIEQIIWTHMLGTSLGGCLAQCFVRKYSDWVDHLILSNTSVPSAIPTKLYSVSLKVFSLLPIHLLRFFIKQNMHKLMSSSIPDTDQAFWKAFWEEKEIFHIRHMTRAELMSTGKCLFDYAKNYTFSPDDLGDWPRKIVIFESDDDPVFKPPARESLRNLYPQAHVYTFHKAGHTPGYSNPEEYIAVVKHFLKES